MKGTEYILNALVTEGISHVFLVPGGLLDPFVASFEKVPKLTPIVAACEAGAAFMADGYARASGKFGVCFGIGGPGITNMVTAISAAYSDSSPVLAISGEVPTYMEGRGQFQDASAATINDTAILRTITAFSQEVEDASLLNTIFNEALVTMLDAPNRPVHLSIPHNIQQAEIAVAHKRLDLEICSHSFIEDAAIEKTLDRISDSSKYGSFAKKIAILAGAGVEHASASDVLLALAERYDIPVATTLRAKGVFPEDHPLSLGVFGYAGTRHATDALLSDELELLIVVGSSMKVRDSMYWSAKLAPSRGIVFVNISSVDLGKEKKDDSIIIKSDAYSFLKHLSDDRSQKSESLKLGRDERIKWLSDVKSKPRFYDLENTQSQAIPIHPARIVAEMRKALPRDTVVLIDSGAHRAFAGQYWQAYEPRHYLSATTLGPMGWAIPAAIGAKIARPDLPCAVITGDGCMLMHGMEIQTAARYNIPVIYVVINNSALGNVWLRAKDEGELAAKLTELPDHDWAAFAKSLGVGSVTVRDPNDLPGAFERALSSNAAFLIEVKADKKYTTPIEPFAEAKKAWSYHE